MSPLVRPLVLLVLAGGLARAEPTTKFESVGPYPHRPVDFEPLKVGDARAPEHRAYLDLARHARRFSAADLLADARKDVSYSNLMAKNDALREDVRFELIRFDGRLMRLKRIGTYPELETAGILTLFEAWVFPTGVDKPVCIHLTDAPADIEPAENISPSRAVTVAGYFFKVVQYPSNEPNPKQPDATMLRRAPLLVGRTLTDAPTPPTPETGETVVLKLLPVVAVGGSLLVLLIAGLTLWFRRTDAAARAYKSKMNRNPFDSPTAGDQS
jgi:hypothetical protein